MGYHTKLKRLHESGDKGGKVSFGTTKNVTDHVLHDLMNVPDNSCSDNVRRHVQMI